MTWRLYKSKCQVCHGADGKGTAAGQKLGAKDFHSPEVQKQSDAELIEATKEGKGKMPAYDKKLTDDQIKQLIKYIRSLNDLSDRGSFVASVRRSRLQSAEMFYTDLDLRRF